MLELKDIKKDYEVAGESVHALKGVSISFRKSEFVSILGASGCGKTTLLNIIGGLDKYTSGDLIIEGVSTKQYTDRDWDTYRNHSIGFIFQSYHLIPHQTILQNVELALMISGVTKKERRRRALEALDKVGLKDKINNRPNQLSGGQAQRVAIARALINDPEIVLADEPTGALDSVTSVQIMELLKEISRDRLVIMVTHNPELAEKYSTRIVNLKDGEITGDSQPYDGSDEAGKTQEEIDEEWRTRESRKGSKEKTSMPFSMSMGLSLKNLLSKRKRTAMVSVAGSIGIIGVSLVLAISSGVTSYINTMENDMLSGNPVAIEQSSVDYTSLMTMSNTSTKVDITKLKDKVYVQSLMDTLGNLATNIQKNNDITEKYLAYVASMDKGIYQYISYDYGYEIAHNIYTDFHLTDDDTEGKSMSVSGIRGMYTSILQEQPTYKSYSSIVSSISSFGTLPNDVEYVLSQYDVFAVAADNDDGYTTETQKLTTSQLQEIFSDKSALVMVVEDQQLDDLSLAQFGYFTEKQFLNYAYKAVSEDDASAKDMYDEETGLKGDGSNNGENGFDLSEMIGKNSKQFTWYPNNSVYTKSADGNYVYRPYEKDNFHIEVEYDKNGKVVGYKSVESIGDVASTDKKIDLQVKLILQRKEDVSYGCLDTGLYYTEALSEYARADCRESDIVKYINSLDDNSQYLNSLQYSYYYCYPDSDGKLSWDSAKTTLYYLMDTGSVSELMFSSFDSSSLTQIKADFLGGAPLPESIYIYSIDFDAKNDITDYLDEWNTMCENGESYTYTYDGKTETVTLSEKDKITYTDTVGLIINMVNTMIQMVTIALVAFTSLSLVVSTVMIGIITYVSVVERVKEIGILRAVGARKKDIKRLFNAETFIIGLCAGIIGILVTYLLSLVINIIVNSIAGFWGIAALPVWQAAIMVGVSVVLTLISGLIPASAAAKKDPVVALRTE